MRKFVTIVAASAVTLMVGVAAAPATVAGAVGPPSVAWVSHTTPLAAAGGKSCAKPGYNSVQAAINNTASGAVIHVCAGAPYVEQLQITQPVTIKGAGEGTTTIALPASPANSTTACDAAVNTAYGAYGTTQDEISICQAGSVSISDLTVQPQWPGSTCNDNLYGIMVAGESNLTAADVAVDGGGAFPINGCQGGVAVEVGLTGLSGTYGVGTATLKGDSVTNYQKNGITVDGAGSNALIEHTSVITAPTAATAQNGIQISDGAVGDITHSTISGNECNIPTTCGIDGTQAGGVLLYDSAPGTSVTNSTISGNDYGLYYLSGAASEAASAPTTISHDHFTGDRYSGILLDQGIATLASDSVTANLVSDPGDVGIVLYQYVGQSYASQATATHLQVSGESVAVDVSTDGAPGDLPGTFTISHASETGNTVPLENTSTNFNVVASHVTY